MNKTEGVQSESEEEHRDWSRTMSHSVVAGNDHHTVGTWYDWEKPSTSRSVREKGSHQQSHQSRSSWPRTDGCVWFAQGRGLRSWKFHTKKIFQAPYDPFKWTTLNGNKTHKTTIWTEETDVCPFKNGHTSWAVLTEHWGKSKKEGVRRGKRDENEERATVVRGWLGKTERKHLWWWFELQRSFITS